MASSLDQVGIFSKTAEDAQILFSFLASHDPKDSTSAPRAEEIKKMMSDFRNNPVKELAGSKVVLVKDFHSCLLPGLTSLVYETSRPLGI